MSIRSNKLVMVCNACMKASCWYGEFRCEHSTFAGTVVLTVGDLRKLKLEHPDSWTDKKFLKIYGDARPDFSQELRISLDVARLYLERAAA